MRVDESLLIFYIIYPKTINFLNFLTLQSVQQNKLYLNMRRFFRPPDLKMCEFFEKKEWSVG